MTDLKSLHRKRFWVAAVLFLSLGVSVAANVGHAQDNWPSRLIAAWPPIALLLAIEVVVWIPVHRQGWAWFRRIATLTVASVAAVLSYGHMRAVSGIYGEGANAWLWPLSVDGLVIVASIGLVELSGRIRTAGETPPVSAPVTPESPHETPADSPSDTPDNVSEILSGMKARDAARYGWRHSGETEKAEVVRWLSEQGRREDSVRKAVYAVAPEFQAA